MLMADFVTAVKYQLPIKVVVMKNNDLGQIKWEQMVFLGNPEYGVDLQPIDFAAFARACGATGYTITDPKRAGSLLDEALGTEGPVLIEAVVDRFTAPMPPKVTTEQAVNFAESLARGEPNRAEIVRTAIREKIREMV
jgi:pyruvate dehydrogenase (quinone)